MEYVKELIIPKARFDYLNGLMAKDRINLAEHDLPKYENLETWGVEFGVNGINADIKANTSEDDVWCEGVLFDKDNLEIACTDVSDRLDGEYVWTVGADTFKVIVKSGE